MSSSPRRRLQLRCRTVQPSSASRSAAASSPIFCTSLRASWFLRIGSMKIGCEHDVRSAVQAGDHRPPRLRRGRRTTASVGRHRMERPHQPHVLRDVRFPETLRLLQGEGDEAHARRPPSRTGRRLVRPPGEGGDGRLPPARSWVVGNHDQGRLSPLFRRRRGQVRAALTEEEGELLKGIVREYLELLEADREPCDPVTARLFPSASMDDPTLETDFRELAGDDLLSHKRQTALRVLEYLDTGDRRPLSEEEQEAWLVLLADLRLAMA